MVAICLSSNVISQQMAASNFNIKSKTKQATKNAVKKHSLPFFSCGSITQQLEELAFTFGLFSVMDLIRLTFFSNMVDIHGYK